MELNKQQKNAAHYNGDAKNILVVAGAGTGKTTTIINRIIFLMENNKTDPSRILALTFTNKSAKDLVSKIDAETNNGEMINASTFHSFCIQIIKQIPKSFGYNSGSPLIIDEAGQRALMSDSLSSIVDKFEKDGVIQEEDKALIPKPNQIISYYSYARNSIMNFKEYLFDNITENSDVIDILSATIELYEKQKAEYSYADFDDLLNRFVETLESKDQLRKQISGLYDEILVDELQDTNPIQYRILKAISDNNNRIFGVGDPAQSIYSFRGADFNSIYRFTEVFENSVELYLSENYRSSQEILDFSNQVLKKSSLSYKNMLFSPNGYNKISVKVQDFDSSIEEATFISRDIVNYIQKDNGNFKDIFIITRSAYAARETEAMMNKYNIPYEFIGGKSILKSAHVQDALSLLRFCISHRDKLGCIRFLELFKGVGAKTASKFYNSVKDIDDPLIVSQNLEKTVKKETELSVNLYLSCYYAKRNSKNAINEMLNNGFMEIIKTKYPDSYEYRIKDIELLSKLYKDYNGDMQSFINDFTMEPDLYKVNRGDDDEPDKVILITAHSSKGLERKRCYVLNATPGAFPTKRSIGDKNKEEEERRAFYVAVTRAKDELIITRNMEYNDYIFTNAKTSIDYIKDTKSFYHHKKKKVNAGLGGIKSLKDVF